MELFNHIGKALSRYRVKICAGLIKNENIGLHHHNRGERNKLLFTARKLGGCAVQFIFKVKICRSFRNQKLNLTAAFTEVFNAERKLTANSVAHDALIRILPEVTHGTVNFNLSAKLTRRRNLFFYKRKQSGFTRSGSTRNKTEVTFGYTETD